MIPYDGKKLSAYGNMTNSELLAEKKRVESSLRKVGDEFTKCEPHVFVMIAGEPFNKKDDLGTKVFQLYSALGSVHNEMQLRGMKIRR